MRTFFSPAFYVKLVALEALLLVPFVAQYVTEEVNWTASDFLTMGVLLAMLAFCIQFVLNKIKTIGLRIALIGGILLFFFLFWAELAVGIFDISGK